LSSAGVIITACGKWKGRDKQKQSPKEAEPMAHIDKQRRVSRKHSSCREAKEDKRQIYGA
jgi:hypothetical protein